MDIWWSKRCVAVLGCVLSTLPLALGASDDDQRRTRADHWAFSAPVKPAVPEGATPATNPVDAFIAARLTERGVGFAPEADRSTLARRAALTLTGLPPEPEHLRRFLDDASEDAFDRFVDDLLTSPRFGEHQARYWLDAVRYGDTHGLHLDNRRGVYPYRDWVVRAFNDNLPLDLFLRWQLAGDLLPDPTLEQLIATGFIRMNPTTAEGGAIAAEFQAKNSFDRTESIGTVLFGLTLSCARCHDHKYDPISQAEYYRFLAFFNNTTEGALDGNKYTYQPVLKVPADEPTWERWHWLENARDRLLRDAGRSSEKQRAASEWVASWDQGSTRERIQQIVAGGPFAGTDYQRRARALLPKLEELEASFTTTLIARERKERRPTHILQRGEYSLPTGDPVEPSIPQVLGDWPQSRSRNRLGFADWVTARSNPLVARVWMNRLWQRTFGHPLARTPEDFGVRSEAPTHPELLDWLAVELHDSGWNLKHLLRLLVTSRTFRQSSAVRDDLPDPENRLWGRGPHYRLDAEVLRDIALWSSGLLDPIRGGEGIKPYQPDGMWAALAHPASNTKKYVQDEGRRLYRRSLYVYWKRTSPHPMMTLFDAPDRESSCVGRSRTSTPLQSLALFNETQRVEMARCLAERLLRERTDDDARLDLLFTWVASREPLAPERSACRQLLETQRQRYVATPEDARSLLSIGAASRDPGLDLAAHAAWTQLTTVVLASDPAILLY